MHNFEKLIFGQKSISLAKEIYIACKELSSDEKFGLASQMKRSAVSISSTLQKEVVEITIKNSIILSQSP